VRGGGGEGEPIVVIVAGDATYPPTNASLRGILMTVSVVISMIGLRGEGLVERLAPLRALWLLFVWLWVLRNRL